MTTAGCDSTAGCVSTWPCLPSEIRSCHAERNSTTSPPPGAFHRLRSRGVSAIWEPQATGGFVLRCGATSSYGTGTGPGRLLDGLGISSNAVVWSFSNIDAEVCPWDSSYD